MNERFHDPVVRSFYLASSKAFFSSFVSRFVQRFVPSFVPSFARIHG